jgi:hypothetical protein
MFPIALGVSAEMICPSPDCEAEDGDQHPLTAAELKHVGNPTWGFRAMGCQVCGCIYTGEGNDTFIIRKRSKTEPRGRRKSRLEAL